MTHSFRIGRPELAGLAQLYHEKIAPDLASQEAGRKSAVLRASILTVPIALVGIVASLWLWNNATGDGRMMGPLVTFLVLSVVWAMQLAKVHKSAKHSLVGAVTAHLGWRFSSKAQAPTHFDAYRKFKMLPAHSSSAFEDVISGDVHGSQFVMTEMHLQKRSGKRTVTVFRGFALEVDFHQSFTSTTVVLRDRKLQRRRLGDMKRVGMASPKWEKMFEAYGTDQVEARVKLDPAFMETLMRLEETVDGKKLRFAFFADRLHVICETPNRFEPGSMFKPLVDPRRMQKLIDEVEALFGVIDAVVKRPRASDQAAAQPQMPAPTYSQMSAPQYRPAPVRPLFGSG